MKKVLSALLVVILAACHEQHEPLVNLPDCNKLRASGTFDLTIMNDERNTLQLSGKGADKFEWLHDGTTLVLRTSGSTNLQIDLSCGQLNEFELLGAVQAQQNPDSFAQYEKIAVYGNSSFAAVEINADSLDLRTSGQGALRLDQIVADRVQVLASGQSQQFLAGETERLQATLTGSAQLSAATLSAQRIALTTSGRSRAEVFPTAHIGGTLGGQSAVGYVSNPVLEVALEIQDKAVASRRE
jgi:Putative auto-transporter adhesin, head GIN domain